MTSPLWHFTPSTYRQVDHPVHLDITSSFSICFFLAFFCSFSHFQGLYSKTLNYRCFFFIFPGWKATVQPLTMSNQPLWTLHLCLILGWRAFFLVWTGFPPHLFLWRIRRKRTNAGILMIVRLWMTLIHSRSVSRDSPCPLWYFGRTGDKLPLLFYR